MSENKTISVVDLIQGPTEEYQINQYILTFTDMTRGMVWVNSSKELLQAGDTIEVNQTGNINWKYNNEQQVIPKYKISSTIQDKTTKKSSKKVITETDMFYHKLAFEYLKEKDILTLYNLNTLCRVGTFQTILTNEMKEDETLLLFEDELIKQTERFNNTLKKQK